MLPENYTQKPHLSSKTPYTIPEALNIISPTFCNSPKNLRWILLTGMSHGRNIWSFKRSSVILRLLLDGKNTFFFLVPMMTSSFTFQPFFCLMLLSKPIIPSTLALSTRRIVCITSSLSNLKSYQQLSTM